MPPGSREPTAHHFHYPFGRFKFLAYLQFQNITTAAFAGLTGYRRIVDDIVIYDSDEAQNTDYVRQFLRRCSETKITLNTEKWLFAKTEVNFTGFHLSAAGYRVDDSITEAISKFPISCSDLRSFVGLVNQLSSSTPLSLACWPPYAPS